MKLLTFSGYEEYKRIQVAANKLKYRQVYAEDPELHRIASHFKRCLPNAKSGLCHGVRNGYEVQMLRRVLPQLNVVGTDISDTAASAPHCIEWDMHEVKPEWVGAIDFMYSNSWDHTYDPQLLFSRWSSCLSPEGRLYLPYTEWQSERGVSDTTKIDVFGCSLDELIAVVAPYFEIEDVLEVTPRFTTQVIRRRLDYLRAGGWRQALMAKVTSRRVVVLVLSRRTA